MLRDRHTEACVAKLTKRVDLHVHTCRGYCARLTWVTSILSEMKTEVFCFHFDQHGRCWCIAVFFLLAAWGRHFNWCAVDGNWFPHIPAPSHLIWHSYATIGVKTLVKIPIVYGGRSNLTSNSKFNHFEFVSLSALIKVRISKFGPTMHLSTVKVPIDFGIDCARSSALFSIENQLLSSTYWRFFYYRPPGKCRYTAEEIAKM